MNYDKPILGEKIILRNITMANCTEKYVNWLNDINVNRYLESRLSIQTSESIKNFVSNILESKDNYMFAIFHKESNEHIGNVKIGPIHSVYKNAFVGYIIGDKNYWGKGFATEAVYLATKFCFDVLKLHKVNAGVIAHNIRSIKVLEKLGFKKEACIRDDEFQDGEYWDIYRYGIIEKELIPSSCISSRHAMDLNMKLCLGTAQFGLDYGINNTKGKIPKEEVIEILNFAFDNGITNIDTASAYGSSESVLGEGIIQIGKNFQIITKYPANTEIRPFQWIETSLDLLHLEKVYGYLFHNYSIFQNNPNYIEDFIKIKETGKAEKIGFSLYHPSEAEYILKNNVPCDIVQIPYNIFDQRFDYLFSEFNNKAIDVYVRSVFLQGLFFVEPDKLSSNFESIKGFLQDIHQFAKDYSINAAMLCLGFAYANKNVSYIVIGIDSLDNLKENISNYSLLKDITLPYNSLKKFAVNDENIILPYNWRN